MTRLARKTFRIQKEQFQTTKNQNISPLNCYGSIHQKPTCETIGKVFQPINRSGLSSFNLTLIAASHEEIVTALRLSYHSPQRHPFHSRSTRLRPRSTCGTPPPEHHLLVTQICRSASRRTRSDVAPLSIVDRSTSPLEDRRLGGRDSLMSPGR
jgi:hypothetical protein